MSFEARARELLLAGEHAPLIDYEKLGRDAMLSIPTPDHYLPLPYSWAQAWRKSAENYGLTAIAIMDVGGQGR